MYVTFHRPTELPTHCLCAPLFAGLSECLCHSNPQMKRSIAPLNRLRAGLQGGGVYVTVYVTSNGVANFEGCNIHDNTASYVCLHLELTLNFHPSPH